MLAPRAMPTSSSRSGTGIIRTPLPLSMNAIFWPGRKARRSRTPSESRFEILRRRFDRDRRFLTFDLHMVRNDQAPVRARLAPSLGFMPAADARRRQPRPAVIATSAAAPSRLIRRRRARVGSSPTVGEKSDRSRKRRLKTSAWAGAHDGGLSDSGGAAGRPPPPVLPGIGTSKTPSDVATNVIL